MSYYTTQTPFSETATYKMGDAVQREWATICVTCGGGIVLPVYDYTEISPEDKAPMVMHRGGDLIAPDLLYAATDKPIRWHEVKAKTSPTYRRCPPGPRWEHGIDYSCAMEYQQVQNESGIPTLIIVHEPPHLWLSISLNLALFIGDHRTDWPGGKTEPRRRGRRGLGGLLWPRAEMYWFDESTKKWRKNPPEPREE